MALFGRRKPGFAKEEIVKKDEIPQEFNDALDPAMNKDTVAPGEDGMPQQGDKPQLVDFLESLPEVEDNFPPFPPEEEPPAPVEKTYAQVLADFIRDRTQGGVLTGKKQLETEEQDLEALLLALAADETCKDIVAITGNKDIYYYSDEHMTGNYASIIMLVEEKDMPRTIAEMVRFNCKTYPSATPEAYFTKHPYFMTQPQIDRALGTMAQNSDYQDIKRVKASNGINYLYSSLYFSDKYGKAMANYGEEDEFGLY